MKKTLEATANIQISFLKKLSYFREERVISTAQQAEIIANQKKVINLSSCNYLGLSNHPRLIAKAKEVLDSHGFGVSSVRLTAGTQDIHQQLEQTIAEYYGVEASLLFSSAFDANMGFFSALFNDKDVILSDRLNHASLITGIKLCKAERIIYKHLDLEDLEQGLKRSQKARHRIIVTDGIFSMDGDLAPLDKLYELAQKYDAYLFVDECHAAGFIGETGKGTPEHFGLHGKIDFISSTLGKSMGGASGGFIACKRPFVELLKNKATPFLFSNSLAPCLTGAAIEAYKIVQEDTSLRQKLHQNTRYFRSRMKQQGFRILGHELSPIAPIYVGDSERAMKISKEMMDEGVFVTSSNYPVVPVGQARMRVILSAAHTEQQIEHSIKAFVKLSKKADLVKEFI